jgi:hypothetical protein
MRVTELGTYTRIRHVVEARITSFDIMHGTSSRQRTSRGRRCSCSSSGGRLRRRNVLRRERLWWVLEHWMEVRIVTRRRRLQVGGRGVRGTGWARIIGWYRGISRRNHVGSRGDIGISFGRRAAT